MDHSDNVYENLLTKDAFLKAFLENSEEAIAIFDLGTQKMVLTNDKVEALFKCSKADILSSDPARFLPEFQPDGTPSMEMAITNFSEIHSKGKISYNWQQKAADGTLFYTSITGIKVVVDNFDLCLVLHRDLTQEIETEKKIGAEREQFKFLFDNAYDGIITYDTKLQKHVNCNERLISYLEAESQEEILTEYWKFSEPIQWDGVPIETAKKEFITKVNQAGKHRYNWIHRTKNGKIVISEMTTMIMSAPNEHIRLSIIKDITKEKNTLSELEKNKRELLNSQSIAKMASFRYDVEKDHLVWSEYAYNILGINPKNAPTELKHFLKYINEKDRNSLVESLFHGKKNVSNIESNFKIFDQSKNPIYCHFKAEVAVTDGKLTFFGSVQDVTEQTKNMAAIRETYSKYIDLFDNMYDALLIIDADGNFNDGNIAAERLLGYSKDELKTIKIPDIVHPEDKEKSKRFLDKLLKHGYYSDYTGRVLRKDGSVRHLQVNSTAIFKDGKFTGSRDIARDITNIKEAEAKREELLAELERVNLELKNFAHIVSHDLKAPLRAISSLSTWLLEDYKNKLDASGLEKLELIHSRVNRMHNFIEAILEYSKIGITAGKVEQIDLNIVIQDIEEALNPPKNFKITISNRLPLFNGDRTRLTQLFQNLISNAIKHTDKENGEVKIEWKKINGRIEFCIIDNGPGIPEKDHNRIFQIFQTLQSRDEIESTGIGLTIVKRIVNLYNGNISVISEKGKGACFKFELQEQVPKIISTSN